MKNNLEYSVIICTYKRPDVVKLSLMNCLKQSIFPRQIIIVDASPDFARQKGRILRNLIIPEKTELLYLEAAKPSAAFQRNQGIMASDKVDVLFFLDDDSFIYENCAEKILEIYAADKAHSIAGIQAALADRPPGDAIETANEIETKKRRLDYKLAKTLENVFRLLFKYVFLMSDTQLFIPYYGKYKTGGIVKINNKEFHQLNMCQGCRMTFRYDLARENLFDKDLVKYSAGEDLDLSYRISQLGDLIECSDAKVYHRTAAAGRLNRYKSASMYSFDLALFVKRNSNDLNRDQRRYVILGIRRFFAEFFKDLLSLRFTFPQLRGVVRGTYYGLLLLLKKELDESYVKRHLSTY